MPADAATYRSPRRNVIVFGDVGSGKSSLINLIGGKPEAATSSGAKSCTLHSTQHIVKLNHLEFALYDTAGMHEAKKNMGSTEYLDVIYEAYTLISDLECSGGISLLIFCMRSGRVTSTMQETYNLFVDVLCQSRASIIIAVTHLESEQPMEKWWEDNVGHIKEYGLRSDGHACLTTIRGRKNEFESDYEESRTVIRKALLDHSDRAVWTEERAGWVKRVAIYMVKWLSLSSTGRAESVPDLKEKLVKLCGFSPMDADAVLHKIQTRRDSMPQPEAVSVKTVKTRTQSRFSLFNLKGKNVDT